MDFYDHLSVERGTWCPPFMNLANMLAVRKTFPSTCYDFSGNRVPMKNTHRQFLTAAYTRHREL